MRVLVGCERSGRVRDAFLARGHDAMSCDLVPSDAPGPHHCGPVEDVIGDGWDLGIFHPPCTYMANSGARWLFEKEGRWAQLDAGVAFFLTCYHAPILRVAVENPMPHKWAMERIGIAYDQRVQPWYFGDRQKKGTCLWLRGLPPLQPTNVLPPPLDAEERKGWESVWREPPGPDQAKNRSLTFPGMADAMAEQWGRLPDPTSLDSLLWLTNAREVPRGS